MKLSVLEGLLHRPGLSLLVGPPLSSHREFLYGFVASVLEGGMPVLLVLTDEGAPEARARLRTRGIDVDALEAQKRLWHVDAFSPSVGWAHTAPNTVFVEEDGTAGLLLAISEVEATLVEKFPAHVVVVDSLSTLLVLYGSGEAFAIARGLRGLSARLGAIVIASLTAGMHPEREVVPLAHLAANLVHMDEQGNTEIRAQPHASEHLVKGWG